ncbi:hypothetical protein JCM3774_004443 [Rhodotorula dairenensis]
MDGKTCLLTVGSTRFDSLVRAFLCPDSLDSLPALGITQVVAQVGNSALPHGFEEGSTRLPRGLRLRILRFANDLEEQVGQAHLVVSHAGAGSILSFLRPLTESADAPTAHQLEDRALVLVPNSTLMDSHQADLAEEMNKKGWATVCWSTEDLPVTLRQLTTKRDSLARKHNNDGDFQALVDPGKVQRILDEVLGYT